MRIVAFSTLSILLGLVTVACGPVATPSLTSTLSPSPTIVPEPTQELPTLTTVPTPTVTPSPTSTPIPTPTVKVLRIGLVSYPTVIDPQRSASGNGDTVLKLVYEGLLSVDENGNIDPGGADQWELAKDGTSMTFHIRDGLKRVDGTPITAKDYAYALTRAVDPRVLDKVLSYVLYDVKGAQELDAMDPAKVTSGDIDKALANYGVKASDDHTLVVTFTRPIGYWQFIASTLVTFPTDKLQVDKDPEQWWTKPEGYNGNGPFKVVSIDPGKKIVLGANENYWRGKPKLDRIELTYFADSKEMLDAYETGAIDIAGNIALGDLPAGNTGQALDVDLVTHPLALSYALGFNISRKPFDDQNVRRAFSQAIDRDGWVRQVLEGNGEPYTRWLPPGVLGAQSDLPGVPGYDPQSAVLTLVNNGYAAKDSTSAQPKVDCAKLGELKFTYDISDTFQVSNFNFLKSDFAQVLGCSPTLDPVDSAQFNSLSQNNATRPLISVEVWLGDYQHPQNWLSLLWRCGSLFSRLDGYCSNDLDALLTKADAEPDTQKSIQLYQQAEDLLMKDVPAAFTSYKETRSLIKPYVLGPKEHLGSEDVDWPGESGPVWNYDMDLSSVPPSYLR